MRLFRRLRLPFFQKNGVMQEEVVDSGTREAAYAIPLQEVIQALEKLVLGVQGVNAVRIQSIKRGQDGQFHVRFEVRPKSGYKRREPFEALRNSIKTAVIQRADILRAQIVVMRNMKIRSRPEFP